MISFKGSYSSRLIAAALGFFLLAGHLLPSASAAEYAEAVVRSAVQTWVRAVTADARPEAEIDRVEPYTRNGATAAYVIHFVNGGYCIAGADSLVLPVYWYSPRGTYDPANQNSQAILEEVADRLDFLKGLPAGDPLLDLYREDLQSRAALWESLAAGNPPNGPRPGTPVAQSISSLSSLVLPLLSQWHQGSPYNDVCPTVPFGLPPGMDNTNAIVGCVATAMAQVMYYWRWPITGEGTASGTYHHRWTSATLYTSLANDPQIPPGWEGGRLGWSAGQLYLTGSWDQSLLNAAGTITNDFFYWLALGALYGSMSDNQTTFSVDFGNTTYNWSILATNHTDPVDAGDEEVARLSFHAGVSVNMSYGLLRSGAFANHIPGALRQHFRYDQDVRHDSVDANRIVDEIQWQRPVLLGGQSVIGGHAWVVYGYNQGTSPWQFNMNLGWRNPDDNGLYSFDNIRRGFTNSLEQVTRIAPRYVVGFVGASGSGTGSPGSPYKDIEEAVANAANHATLIFKADSFNSFTAPQLTINKPLTLKGINSTLAK